MATPSSKLPHDQTVLFLALLGGLPAVLLSGWLLWARVRPGSAAALAALAIGGFWIVFGVAAQRCVVRPLQTMSNLLLALRQGDFSFRARNTEPNGPLSVVLGEINALSSVLQTQRQNAIEAAALLRTVTEEIDVAIFAFDADQKLRLINRAGEKMVGKSGESLLGRSAEAIGIASCLAGESNRILAASELPVQAGRWGLRRKPFRQDGLPHQVLVIADLSQPLREQELKAWQRLVQVLGHELNNSLAPIKSIAGSLGSSLDRQPRPDDWETDMRRGLDIIASRADSLAHFLQAYSRLARLPPPKPARCQIGGLVSRVVDLETRLPVAVRPGPLLSLSCDSAQIEQSLINVIQNAVDAALEQRAAGAPDAGVRLDWNTAGEFVEIRVEDDGPGVSHASNLFVPFFTTKADGSGIGLVLCRQIAENHGGSITLQNRPGAKGCVATLRLPLS